LLPPNASTKPKRTAPQQTTKMRNRSRGKLLNEDGLALLHRPTTAGVESFRTLMRAPRRLDPDRVVEHLPRLYRAARAWTRSREEAEDLVQETYARVLARPRMIRGEDELGYLLRALRNTLISQRRAESRRPATTELVGDALGTRASDDPAEATETRQVFAAIA
jgi:DNA-directed RNA polymerase specialized sigma24 family protein